MLAARGFLLSVFACAAVLLAVASHTTGPASAARAAAVRPAAAAPADLTWGP